MTNITEMTLPERISNCLSALDVIQEKWDLTVTQQAVIGRIKAVLVDSRKALTISTEDLFGGNND